MLPRNSLCHITDILQTLHGTFTDSLHCSRIHGNVMQSRYFPGFPNDHGIIMDSRNIHGFRSYGTFTENSRNFHGLLSTYPIKVKLQLLRKYQNIFQNIPNYRKVTNKSKKNKYFVPIFRFRDFRDSVKFPCFVMGDSYLYFFCTTRNHLYVILARGCCSQIDR